jgi:hypothetical protein
MSTEWKRVVNIAVQSLYPRCLPDRITVLRQCSSTFRQLRTTTWAVGADSDHSAILTFPLALRRMRLSSVLRITEKLYSKLPTPHFSYTAILSNFQIILFITWHTILYGPHNSKAHLVDRYRQAVACGPHFD